MANEKFLKLMEESQEKIKKEQEQMKIFLDSIDWSDPSFLPQPLPEGHVPNPKFEKLMAESRERLAKEQEGLKDFWDMVAGLPLPTPIEKSEDKKD